MFSLPTALVALFVAFGGSAYASCVPIASPTEDATLEAMKNKLSAGDVAAAFAEFDLSDESRAQLVAEVSGVLPEPATSCTSIKRSRPSENFISELFAVESGGTFFFFSVSGLVQGDGLRIVNLRYAADFDAFRDSVS